MSQLSIRGMVRWMNGIWGASQPAEGATVRIFQNSVMPVEKREIWSGVTDGTGEYRGTTSEWRRMKTVRVGAFERTEPDPSDILALTFEVTQGGRSATGPYAWTSGLLPAPPIVLGWAPPSVGAVDGVEFYSAAAMVRRFADMVNGSGPRAISIRVPEVLAASPLQPVLDALNAKLDQYVRPADTRTGETRAVLAFSQSAWRTAAAPAQAVVGRDLGHAKNIHSRLMAETTVATQRVKTEGSQVFARFRGVESEAGQLKQTLMTLRDRIDANLTTALAYLLDAMAEVAGPLRPLLLDRVLGVLRRAQELVAVLLAALLTRMIQLLSGTSNAMARFHRTADQIILNIG